MHTSNSAIICYKPIYTVTRLIGDKPIFDVFSNSIFKRRNNTRTGSPYNMESGNGIPVRSEERRVGKECTNGGTQESKKQRKSNKKHRVEQVMQQYKR